MTKLKVSTYKTIGDLQNLLNAKTGREIKLALEGYTIIPLKRHTATEMNRTWKPKTQWELYTPEAHQTYLDKMSGVNE